jgi:hypothetical protein
VSDLGFKTTLEPFARADESLTFLRDGVVLQHITAMIDRMEELGADQDDLAAVFIHYAAVVCASPARQMP